MAPPSKAVTNSAAKFSPNQTLYVTNLPSAKIRKNDLRRSLYLLFSTYGSVLDVVALKTMKMRGQAHVVMKDIQTATQAMRELQGTEFYGLDMKIEYAKTKSHTISKMDGTFKIPETASTAPVASTELQKSIFSGPPVTESAITGMKDVNSSSADAGKENGEAHGTKRAREDDEEEQSEEDDDVEMEVESDEE